MNVYISSLKILKHTLSVELGVMGDVAPISAIKRKYCRFMLSTTKGSTVWFRGKVVSVEKGHCVIHTKINIAVIGRLVRMRKSTLTMVSDSSSRDSNRGNDRDNTRDGIRTDYQDDTMLSALLHGAAQKLGITEEDLIQKLTAYTSRDGVQHGGKRSIEEVSDKQKIVLYDKVKRLIRSISNVPAIGEITEKDQGN